MYKKIIITSILFIFYLSSMVYVYCDSSKRARDYFQPIRVLSLSGITYSDPDDETKIKSSSTLHIRNYSVYEQRVIFVVYQHGLLKEEDYFFDIDCITITNQTDEKKVKENEIIIVPSGETLVINIEATARDSSKALISGGEPLVKIAVVK